MNTDTITRAFTNSATPAARLAAWQNLPIQTRLAALRKHRAPGYPCRPADMKDPASPAEWRKALIHDPASQLAAIPLVHDNTLHSVRLEGPEVWNHWRGREFLDHQGWFIDGEICGEVYEACAVMLTRFPGIMFQALSDPWNDGLVEVDLSSGVRIDFTGCRYMGDADHRTMRAARDAIQSADRTACRRAEDEREYQEKFRKECEIEENRETLKTLRAEIRELVRELKGACPRPDYPAASRAVRGYLSRLLTERRELITRNAELAASL